MHCLGEMLIPGFQEAVGSDFLSSHLNTSRDKVSLGPSVNQWFKVRRNDCTSSTTSYPGPNQIQPAVKQVFCFLILGLPEMPYSYLLTNPVIHLPLILCVLSVIPFYYPELVSVACCQGTLTTSHPLKAIAMIQVRGGPKLNKGVPFPSGGSGVKILWLKRYF